MNGWLNTVLVFDVGNTNIVFGLFQGSRLLHHWRISTVLERTTDEMALLVKGLVREQGLQDVSIEGIIISSVVPPIMPVMERMCHQYFGLFPLIVGPGIKTGLDIKAENPREVGSDRIVNVVGALEFYEPPLIIVDFGTATTFCVVDEKGHYVGGAIAPGIKIASEALFQSAAKLPRVELSKPRHVIGRNTVTSMQSGLVFGFVGLVDGIVNRMQTELPLPFTIVGTGGFCELIGPESSTVSHIHPLLTLEGLRVLWERNRER